MSPLDHAEDLAKKLEGNWRRFDSFAWFDKPEDADRHCIVYTHNRDSDVLTRCNAAIIDERLRAVPTFEDDATVFNANHWACGWVKGYAIRVRNKAGELTPTFLAYAELATAIEEYPSLDEHRLSEMEFDEACETWAQMSVKERVEAWRACLYSPHHPIPDFHLMACRRDELPSDTGRLNEYLRG